MKYLALAILVLFPQSGPPKATDPVWTVVFAFKQGNGFEPNCRMYVSTQAKTEGEAAIRAHNYLSEKLSIPAAGQLEFVEAQQRQPEK